MNRKIRAVAASLVVTVFPAVGLADAPAPDREPASWALGGGIALGYLDYLAGSSVSLLPTRVASIPGGSGSLERRVSERSWLFLNLEGHFQRTRMDVPAGRSGLERDDARLLSAAVGLRRPVTRPGAAVEVAATAAVHGGALDAEQRYVSSSTVSEDLSTWFAGAGVGVAVERELADGLALRISTPLLRGTYYRGRVRQEQQPTRRSSGVSVDVALAPRLELVLFF